MLLQCAAVINQARAFGKFFAQVLKRYCRYLLCLPTALVLPTKRKKRLRRISILWAKLSEKRCLPFDRMWLPDS